jgi:adenylate cyclase
MIAKIFLAVALVVGAALFVQSGRDAQREADALKHETGESANAIAHIIVGVVEHTMLQGDGIQLKELIAAVVERVQDARVQVFDQRGIEVFAPKPPPPPPSEVPPRVLATIQGHQRSEEGGTIFRPLVNEERCRKCHPAEDALRGVLAIEVDQKACATMRETALMQLVESGFIHVMTADRSTLLDDYFAELSVVAPGIRGAAVFAVDGTLSFGKEIEGLDEAQVRAAVSGRKSAPHQGGQLDLIPLPMQERCVQCHPKSGPVRGVLALSLAPAAAGGMCESAELESVIDTSLRYIMLSRLGRRIADFLDAAAATGAVKRLELYDNVGRRYWTTAHPAPPEDVAGVLHARQQSSMLVGEGERERSVVVAPLVNGSGCQRCHGGSGDDSRGVVRVSLSTASAAKAREEAIRRRAVWSGVTLLAILIVLVGLLQYFVLRPVRQIGVVADAVGEGNLGVMVPRASPDGDEVARLGNRINHMVSGLRTKSQLEKFVSRGASHAAHVAGAGFGGVGRQGERRAATVLFSDIRGFTTYSETVQPERVVEMLNRVLDAQARIVHIHGGDIDKFVGDELMAVFQGPGAEARAVRCAVEMIEAVHDARVAGENLGVGIGLACGEVVYGAMGSEHRMDFTVIGDVVNTGARLCSSADADQVLITAPVANAAWPLEGIELVPHEPLQVKGKREPLAVIEARRAPRA